MSVKFDQRPGNQPLDLNGVQIWPEFLPPAKQQAMVADIRRICRTVPLDQYATARGRKMSVQMTAAGEWGWISDRGGYRYERTHGSGRRWPPIPDRLLDIWRAVSNVDRDPDSCLVNYYGKDARMGLHQDMNETDLAMPVVSLSLGDAGLFRVGGLTRSDPTVSHWLTSGDVAVLAGDARLAFHGIDKIRFGSSDLLKGHGRLNLTLRVAGPVQ